MTKFLGKLQLIRGEFSNCGNNVLNAITILKFVKYEQSHCQNWKQTKEQLMLWASFLKITDIFYFLLINIWFSTKNWNLSKNFKTIWDFQEKYFNFLRNISFNLIQNFLCELFSNCLLKSENIFEFGRGDLPRSIFWSCLYKNSHEAQISKFLKSSWWWFQKFEIYPQFAGPPLKAMFSHAYSKQNTSKYYMDYVVFLACSSLVLFKMWH